MVEVALLDHLEMQVRHERELREEQLRSSGLALKLQASEYERRLETLNGNNQNVSDLTKTFLTQDAFRAWTDSRLAAEERLREADLTWKRNIDRQLSEARGASNRTFALITTLLVAVSVALKFWP